MQKGIITEIQRFSLHDGPGIRTTVFLKGCNMSCAWCHNPETISIKKEVQYLSNKCIKCGNCYKICPTEKIKNIDGEVYIDNNIECKRCWKCVESCLGNAIRIVGNEITAVDVVKEVMIDMPYYDASDGGVTISGGEPFMQPKFLKEILRMCKQEGIHTAIETNLSLSWDTISDILPLVDLIMFDIKLFDNVKHVEWTRSDNKNILENAKKLDKLGIPYIVRTPIIPTVNDNKDEISKISEFLFTLDNLIYYELIPFNPLAEEKFKRLNKEYKLENIKTVDKTVMNELKETAKKIGVEVRIMEE